MASLTDTGGAILDRAYGRAPQAVRMDAEVGFRGSALIAAIAALDEVESEAAKGADEAGYLADQRRAQVDDR